MPTLLGNLRPITSTGVATGAGYNSEDKFKLSNAFIPPMPKWCDFSALSRNKTVRNNSYNISSSPALCYSH